MKSAGLYVCVCVNDCLALIVGRWVATWVDEKARADQTPHLKSVPKALHPVISYGGLALQQS